MQEELILIKPNITLKNEILVYRSEFGEPNGHIAGSSFLNKFDSFEEWIQECELFENKETLPDKNFVPSIQYILINSKSKKVIGFLHLRLELNDALNQIGGHIGYSIAPSERRKGYASLMLKKGLEKANDFSMTNILITCDDDNVASSKVIEANGGKLENKIFLEDEQTLVRRYWINL